MFTSLGMRLLTLPSHENLTRIMSPACGVKHNNQVNKYSPATILFPDTLLNFQKQSGHETNLVPALKYIFAIQFKSWKYTTLNHSYDYTFLLHNRLTTFTQCMSFVNNVFRYGSECSIFLPIYCFVVKCGGF